MPKKPSVEVKFKVLNDADRTPCVDLSLGRTTRRFSPSDARIVAASLVEAAEHAEIFSCVADGIPAKEASVQIARINKTLHKKRNRCNPKN